MIAMVRGVCMLQPRTRALDEDEQMGPFSGRVGIRQCLSSKPNPVMIKLFVLACPSKKVLNFHVYQGKTALEDNDCQRKYGVGAQGVLKLLEGVKPD